MGEISDIVSKMQNTMDKSGPSVAAVGEIGTAAGKLASEVKTLHELEKRAFPGKTATELGGRPLMKLQTELDSQRYSANSPSWLSPSFLSPTNEIQGRAHGPPGRVEGGMVVHAAGVLADGLIMPNHGDLGKKFSKCMASKAHCAWHIHRMMAAF